MRIHTFILHTTLLLTRLNSFSYAIYTCIYLQFCSVSNLVFGLSFWKNSIKLFIHLFSYYYNALIPRRSIKKIYFFFRNTVKRIERYYIHSCDLFFSCCTEGLNWNRFLVTPARLILLGFPNLFSPIAPFGFQKSLDAPSPTINF